MINNLVKFNLIDGGTFSVDTYRIAAWLTRPDQKGTELLVTLADDVVRTFHVAESEKTVEKRIKKAEGYDD